MTEMIHYLIGIVTMTILFASSYLFWNWYTTKNKNDDFRYGTSSDESGDVDSSEIENETNNKDTSAVLDQLLSRKETSASLNGITDKYNWNQTEKEVEVYVKVPSSTKGKDVNCKIRSNTLYVNLKGETMIDGKLFAAVVPDECNWQIDGEGDERKVWITLFKETPTTKNQHWRCVIQGDPEIDISSLGPPVHHLDVNDKTGMEEAIKQVSKYRK